MADAGWYPDAQDPNAQHYFDGENWTGQRRPNQPDAVEQPSTTPDDMTVQRSDLPGRPAAGAPPIFQAQNPQGYPVPDAQGATTSFQPSAWDQGSSAPADGGWAPVPAQAPAPTWTSPAQGGYQPPQQQAPQQGGGWSAPATAQQAGPWQPEGQPSQWSPTPPPGRNRRKPLIIAGVAVVALVAGLATYLVWPSDDAPPITYKGKEVTAAADTLTKAETAVNATVESRHGAKNDETRCYFARPKTPESGAKKSDVENVLRCGPVLFVDGNTSATYLRVPLTEEQSSGKVKLTPQDDISSIAPTAIEADTALVRTDKKTAPDGSGGLKVPSPPAANKDVLTATSLGSTPPPRSLSGAVMVGKSLKATLTSAGEIERYGAGEDARSAPDGQKLLAFQVSYGAGDVSSSGSTKASLVVDGGTPRDLPSASGSTYVVAAVPSNGSAVLRLDEAGFVQTLSLPDGKPGSDNIEVLRRTNKSGFLGQTKSVSLSASRGGPAVPLTFMATATFAALDFWAPGNTAIHPSSPRNAILSVKLNYTDKSSPGKTYGFPTDLVRLRIGSKYVKARNIATSSSKILNVFEVPASFTEGSVEIQGSTKNGGITVKVKKTVTFSIRIRNS